MSGRGRTVGPVPDGNYGFVAATPDVPLPELPVGTPAALARYLVALADVRERQLAELELDSEATDVSPADLRIAAAVIDDVYRLADS